MEILVKKNVFAPGLPVERVGGQREPGDTGAGSVLIWIAPLAAVNRENFQTPVGVEVGQRDTVEGTSSGRRRRNDSSPAETAHDTARVFEIQEMSLPACDHGVVEAVSIGITHGEVKGSAHLPAFGKRKAKPGVGVIGTEDDADIAPFAVNRDHVENVVVVEIGHAETVAASNRDCPTQGLVVDEVLFPGNVAAVLCLGLRETPGDGIAVSLRAAGETCRDRNQAGEDDFHNVGFSQQKLVSAGLSFNLATDSRSPQPRRRKHSTLTEGVGRRRIFRLRSVP